MKQYDVTYYLASKEQRIGEYIIDRIAVFIVFMFLCFLAGICIGLNHLNVDVEGLDFKIYSLIFYLLLYIYYYYALEYYWGVTLGKLIMGTRAVTENGLELTSGEAFKRSMCRLIPFDVWSFLGTRGWHDSISRTVVIKKSAPLIVQEESLSVPNSV